MPASARNRSSKNEPNSHNESDRTSLGVPSNPKKIRGSSQAIPPNLPKAKNAAKEKPSDDEIEQTTDKPVGTKRNRKAIRDPKEAQATSQVAKKSQADFASDDETKEEEEEEPLPSSGRKKQRVSNHGTSQGKRRLDDHSSEDDADQPEQEEVEEDYYMSDTERGPRKSKEARNSKAEKPKAKSSSKSAKPTEASLRYLNQRESNNQNQPAVSRSTKEEVLQSQKLHHNKMERQLQETAQAVRTIASHVSNPKRSTSWKVIYHKPFSFLCLTSGAQSVNCFTITSTQMKET